MGFEQGWVPHIINANSRDVRQQIILVCIEILIARGDDYIYESC